MDRELVEKLRSGGLSYVDRIRSGEIAPWRAQMLVEMGIEISGFKMLVRCRREGVICPWHFETKLRTHQVAIDESHRLAYKHQYNALQIWYNVRNDRTQFGLDELTDAKKLMLEPLPIEPIVKVLRRIENRIAVLPIHYNLLGRIRQDMITWLGSIWPLNGE